MQPTTSHTTQQCKTHKSEVRRNTTILAQSMVLESGFPRRTICLAVVCLFICLFKSEFSQRCLNFPICWTEQVPARSFCSTLTVLFSQSFSFSLETGFLRGLHLLFFLQALCGECFFVTVSCVLVSVTFILLF